jgi:diguanylate cyclase (GGDEF)-like protein/PAS domain S-box-containing protein
MTNSTHHPDYARAKADSRKLLATLFAILVLAWLAPLSELQGIANYLPLHIFMETVSVVVASTIFILGVHSFYGPANFRAFALGCAFLAVGLLDFGHLLTYSGMPDLLEPGHPELAIAFWLAARYSAAVGLLAAALLNPRDLTGRGRAWIVSGTLIAIGLIYWVILWHLDWLPSTFDAQTGLTRFKIGNEVLLVALYGVAAGLFWLQGLRTRHARFVMLALAAAIMMLSEVFFMFYTNVTDLYNLLGHVYKLLAYAFLYRAVVLTSIREPFEAVQALNTRIEATLDALPDMVFEISADGVIHQYHSNARERDLLLPPERFLNRRLGDVLPPEVVESWIQSMQDIDSTGRVNGREYSLLVPTGMRRFEISGSVLKRPGEQRHYIMVARDITWRHQSEARMAHLMALAAESEQLDEKDLAQTALDTLEALTHSKIGFLHLVSDDQQEIELLAWSTATMASYCRAAYDNHYPVASAGVWADSIRTRAPVIINDYAHLQTKHGLPPGHSDLQRLISVPVLEREKVRMVIGVGNASYDYGDDAVKTVQLFGSELYQIIQRRRAQKSSARSERILKAALDHLPVGVAINTVGENVQFEYMNDNFPLFYRTSREALNSPDAFWNVVYEDPQEREHVKAQVLADFASGDPQRMRWENIPISRHDQDTRFVSAQNVEVPEEGLSVSLVLDVTDRLRTESELRVAATAFSSQEGILITDADSRILRVNPAFEKASGYTQAELLGQKPSLFSSGIHDKSFYQAMWASIEQAGAWHGEIWDRRKNGEICPLSLTISAVRNSEGAIINYVADYIDISNLKKAEEAISKLSYFDTLTGLANRQRMKSQLDNALAWHLTNQQFGGLLMVDLDNFKTINDTLGHDAGDALLIEVTARLQQCVRPGDMVSRYGGDEFVLLFHALGSTAQEASVTLQSLAETILSRLDDTFVLDKSSYYSTCSVGATLFGATSSNALELMKQLDIALFRAKQEGRNCISFFDPAWQTAVSERAQILADLRQGILHHEFEMYFQPQLDEAGKIVAAEALVRWNHPLRGLLNPADFIPIAESSGLMVKLGDEILHLCVAQLASWQKVPETRHLQLSINITADQFYASGFAAQLETLIGQLQLDVSGIMLEFTESMLLGNIDLARTTIERLNEHGLRFAIDDFGTGYSSLAYLSALPMDQLKIDQSFVRNIGIKDKDAAIIRTIIDMARTLDMEVLAEGVETPVQRKYLLQHGCQLFQGFLFSRPVPIAEFNALLAQGPINAC